MSTKKLYRSKDDKKITGLCGGIAQYFGVDSGLIRAIVVLVSVFTAFVPALIVYFVIAFVIPEEGENDGKSVDYHFVDKNNQNDDNNNV